MHLKCMYNEINLNSTDSLSTRKAQQMKLEFSHFNEEYKELTR